MFGRKNSNDQNDNSTTNSAKDSNQVTADTTNVSANGYVSPYATVAKQIETPSPILQPEKDLFQANPAPVNIVPTGQISIEAPATIFTTKTDTDNLLDDPMQVNQILNGDGTSKYVVNQVVAANSLDSSSNLGINPLTQPNSSINEKIDTVLVQNKPEISEPVPIQSVVEDKTLKVPSVRDLNPDVDLAKSVASANDIILKHQGPLNIKDYLDIVIEKNASDLHLTVGYPASIRIDGKLQRIGAELTFENVKELIYQTLGNNQIELLEVNKEVDLSYAHADKARFRVNAYNERGNLAAAYRLIPTKIRTIEELNLPPVLYDFTRMTQGLFLVTGPTGHGKSTTLAAMLQEINANYLKHIVTIEDPIEYVYSKGKALVDQRELGQDTHGWSIALRSILRQDPDVVLIGEMRDFETIQAAITIAETGHLVFATLHTNSAAQSIDRIIDVFPPYQQEQVRTQLAGSLKGILSQRLIPTVGGGRKAAVELMIVTPAIQNLIREGKSFQIDNIISTSFDMGMLALERSLVKMVREGKISVETAQEYAIRPDEVLKLMKSGI